MNRRSAGLGLAALGVLACVVGAAVPGAGSSDQPADGQRNLLKSAAEKGNWRFETHGTAKATFDVSGEELVFNVTEVDDTLWHVQVWQTGLELQDGAQYTLKFKAKAAQPRRLIAQVAMDQEPWEMIGVNETIELTTEWKEYEFTFAAKKPADGGRNRAGFVLGQDVGTVHVKDVVLLGRPKPEGL